MRIARPEVSSFTVALMALALLSYAAVQSIVMQAAMTSPAMTSADAPSGRGAPSVMAAPGPAQPVMMQMDMPQMGVSTMGAAKAHQSRGSSARTGHDVAKHHAACPFCSAAAHLPILAGGVLIRTSQQVAFTAFRVVARHGPRGPPHTQPRARGPPSDPLTL